MQQPDSIDAATMEYAARLIEEGDFSDWIGALSRRKRDRENAQLRRDARIEMRAEMAQHLRAMTNRKDLSAVSVLREIADAPERQHTIMLRDAWPLAWKGWVTIEAILVCNSNQLPPESSYRIRLTERGQKVLSEQDS